ncbi:MAG: hypothetical protein HFG80_06580 [Eubacterium sp.]|nr:hypothetical protein [Eubacterium sp.]
MKRKLAWLFIAALPFAFITGCGENSNDSSSGEDISASDTEYTVSLTDQDYGNVTLGNYIGLSAKKTMVEVTEDDINTEIDNLLYDYIEYKKVDRPSAKDDYIQMSMSVSENGEVIDDYTEDGYEICLGNGEFGAEFDEKLTGVNTGDKLQFSIAYDADDEEAIYAGSTVDYDITVTEISEAIYPELTNEFLKDSLGYDSEEDMRKQVTETLEKDNEENSTLELQENLLQQIIDSSSFENYSDELYEVCSNDVTANYESYSQMFGYENVEDIYEVFGLSEEDIENEIMQQVYRSMTIHALIKEENISLSDEEYQDGVKRYAENYGYSSAEEMENDYGEDALREVLTEEKVLDFLVENAKVTEVPASAEDAEE